MYIGFLNNNIKNINGVNIIHIPENQESIQGSLPAALDHSTYFHACTCSVRQQVHFAKLFFRLLSRYPTSLMDHQRKCS